MTRTVSISEVMQNSGVGFGTSGARGLVSAMTDEVCVAYTLGFLQALRRRGEISQDCPVGIAGDLRPSTGRILQAAAYAIAKAGHPVLHAGRVPSPAIALLGLERALPTLMVTGSHIPDDRNGIKFNKTTGEILKSDEQAIASQTVELCDDFDAEGMLKPGCGILPDPDPTAARHYVSRYLDAFAPRALAGRKIVVYEHSGVGRDLLVEILEGLGAEIVREGRSDRFIPVDTEAIRAEDVALAQGWARQHRPFAIVSTDGDADRPLVSDEQGRWLRGDVLGVLTARYLGAHTLVTPVSSNTVAERSGAFAKVVRTRIGSPYVIERMLAAVAEGSPCVAGYEANGGFLTATPIQIRGGGALAPLPTRDPVIVMLAVLVAAAESGRSVSSLEAELPARATASGRIRDFPNSVSGPRLEALKASGLAGFDELLSSVAGPFLSVDLTDGIRGTTAGDEVLHLRASGNAPELRCYAESTSPARAEELVETALRVIAKAWL